MILNIKANDVNKLKNIYNFNSHPLFRDSIGPDIAKGKKVVFASFDNDFLTGAITLNIEESNIYLNNLIVDKNYRNKGIGSLLVKKAIDYAIKNDFSSIKLNVREDNDAALNIYDNEEFVVTDVKSDASGKYFEMTKSFEKNKTR